MTYNNKINYYHIVLPSNSIILLKVKRPDTNSWVWWISMELAQDLIFIRKTLYNFKGSQDLSISQAVRNFWNHIIILKKDKHL